MRIYFVRHGKTEWNLEKRFQGGQGDSPLLPQSLIDIKKLGQHLKNTKFRAIYSSPLKRAFATAQGIDDAMNAQLPVIIDERLREFNLGKMEGMQFEAAQQKYPAQVDDLWHHPEKYDGHSINGEDYPEVIARGQDFARSVAQKFTNSDDKVLAVSHGAALSAIMGGLLGFSLKNLRQNGSLNNTSLTILETNDQGQTWHSLIWNETDFLDRKLSETDAL
ncbi:histidine phosphatase family protein [Lactobacillus sp. ESL0701]|uniref:histidine phosphatase family protein n=1 Tax=Lactobacillus sp. ESL0701 TaxID=2983217 RepID=UPI0023F77EA0|nr:histidine phosphatase family protein [Lactobacillus sp. ESL0701]MDF7672104.1 histidine phosphatase family protein [Lactobacillus sp. ESL0701]